MDPLGDRRVSRCRPSGSFRSKPAEKALAEPVRITTEVSRSSSKSRGTSRSSRIACWLKALMLSPRSKRTTAMRPCGPRPFSTSTNRRSMARSSCVRRKVAARLYKREPLGLTGPHVEIDRLPSPSNAASTRCSPATPSPVRRAPSSPSCRAARSRSARATASPASSTACRSRRRRAFASPRSASSSPSPRR